MRQELPAASVTLMAAALWVTCIGTRDVYTRMLYVHVCQGEAWWLGSRGKTGKEARIGKGRLQMRETHRNIVHICARVGVRESHTVGGRDAAGDSELEQDAGAGHKGGGQNGSDGGGGIGGDRGCIS